MGNNIETKVGHWLIIIVGVATVSFTIWMWTW